MTPKELAEKRAVLAKRIQEMAQKCHDENREFTAEEQQNWTAINVEYDVLSRRLELTLRTEEIEAHQTAVANNPGGTIGRGDLDPENARTAPRSDLTGRPRRRRYGLNDLSIPHETRDMALRGWMGTQVGADIPEEWEDAALECGIRPEQTWLRLQLFDTPTFRSIPRWPNGAPRLEERAQSTAATEGAELIPEGFIPRLEKAMLQFGGMLQTSEVMRTDKGNDLPWPTVDDTSNKGAILAENAPVTEQDVVFGALTLQAFKYTSKLVKVSVELIQDTAISISETLGDLLGERIGRILQEHFTTGTGTGQSRGIELGAPIGLTTAVGTYDEDDLIDLLHSVDSAYRTGARFMMHDSIIAVTRKFKDLNGQFIWQPGLQLGQPDRVIGHGLSVNQEMDSTVATGNDVVIFGDLSKYKVRIVREIRLRRLVERFADNDQEGFVAFIRADGDLLDAGTGPVKKMRVG